MQKQVDDQQIDLNVPFTLQLDSDTFIDPNGDKLTYTISSTLPEWLSFDAETRKFTGTPTTYGVY